MGSPASDFVITQGMGLLLLTTIASVWHGEGGPSCGCADNHGDGYNGYDSVQCPSGNDCNDSDPTVYPGALEVCDGKDNDCDSQIDEGVTNTYYRDADSDGYGDHSHPIQSCAAPGGYVSNSLDCDDTRSSVHPGATEICDGIDDDCDGMVDEDGGCDPYKCVNGHCTSSCATDGGCIEGYYCNDDGNCVQKKKKMVLFVLQITSVRVEIV